LNYFEHHIGDYDSATAHLSWLEDCAYRRLICLYYRTEAPIPADLRQVYRLLRASAKQEREAIAQVLAEYFELREDGHHQQRCDEEISRYSIKREKAQRSANARWSAHQTHSDGNANASPNAMRTHSDGNANASPNAMRTHSDGNANDMPHVGAGGHGHAPVPTPHYPNPIPSEPGGSGRAGAPPDPADVIFGLGLPLLTAAGVSDRNARSMLGMQRKQHGDQAVIEALQRCATEKPMQPVPWLQAALKHATAPPASKADRVAMANIETAKRYLARTTP